VLTCEGVASAKEKADSCWNVDDIRSGMKGEGRTVMKGTKLETFQAEILGVLRNTSPGRDLILARLSGLNLEKTGVIAGMSGSPVYIDNKLVGAVAYAWAYGKEPIAGITPYSQMVSFAEELERREVAQKAKPARVGLRKPLKIGDQSFDSVTVSQNVADSTDKHGDEMWLTPLATPLASTGMSSRSLKALRGSFADLGLNVIPMQGGGASAKIAEDEKDAPFVPGSPLAVTLIRGDFDLSGIGTVTNIEGKRVYGWGHPFMSLGGCDFPLMTGYIHTIYPRQTVSFKMGSPLQTIGVVNADVSTCIAGWLDKKPDLMPMTMRIGRDGETEIRTFNVEIVRQKSLIAPLVFTALTNTVDMEGDLPDELTAEFTARIEIEGKPAIVLKDTFSGFSGSRAPQAIYGNVSTMVSMLTQHPYKPVRITRIDCETIFSSTRKAAEIEAIEIASDTYAPGDMVEAMVFVRPYKGERQRLPVKLKLPVDLPEGTYTAMVYDETSAVRADIRDNPILSSPQTSDQILDTLKVINSGKRTTLAVRLPLGTTGVSQSGKALPNLPRGTAQILSSSKRTGVQTMSSSVVSRQETPWVIQGSEILKFTVTKNKKAQTPE